MFEKSLKNPQKILKIRPENGTFIISRAPNGKLKFSKNCLKLFKKSKILITASQFGKQQLLMVLEQDFRKIQFENVFFFDIQAIEKKTFFDLRAVKQIFKN